MTAPNTAKADRPFDIVVYGATGYTGRLVAEYLAHHYQGKGPKWAMAGRSAEKLAEVRDLIGAPADTPLVVANSDDPASMKALAESARVIVTTVGPYQLYGEPLLKACVEAGTDYADLCGEPGWMREMIDAYHEQAKASGARIAFSSGFDSIPFDLGVFMLQQEAKARFGSPAPRVKGRVRAMQGTFSGGTAASLTETMKSVARKPSLIPILQSPFGLTPGFEGPSQPMGLLPEYDAALGKWAAPFIMATINTKNVHRTNFLLGHPYGADFKYDEMMLTSPGELGEKAAHAVAEMLKNPFGAKPPKPGEGPTPEERENGFYDVLFVGEWPDGKELRYGVKGRFDPGYGSTSRMIAETGIALLDCPAGGGVATPGALLGEALVKRLQDHAEITFAVEEMTETLVPLREESEWTIGWRIVLGCALAAGAGIVLLFFTFNMFVLPLSQELGVSRGEIGAIQALIVTGALGAVVIGRAVDSYGVKPIYIGSALIVIAGQILSVLFATSIYHMALSIAVLGFFGVGTTSVVTTRPINAHFRKYRGRALGLVATGVSITAIIAPQILVPMIENYGWRGGFLALAGFTALVGIPAIAFIVPASASQAQTTRNQGGGTDWSFLRTRDFRLMATSIIAMGLATAGFVGQLSPIVQEEGFDGRIGAAAVSAFAIGQFVGRLGGGWLLDHFRPQTAALIFTIIPGSGFLLFLLTDQLLWAAILAATMIGLQQGVEQDLFAYFVARRFPIAQYGTVYGTLHGFAWIGNGFGIVGVGMLHDRMGNYELAQIIGMAALCVGAVLVWAVRLPPLASAPSAS